MLDAKRLLDQFLGGAQGSGLGGGDLGNVLGQVGSGLGNPGEFLKGTGGGALAGGLAAILLGTKTGRKLGGTALKMGGIAAVGALAYKAYNDWQASKQPPGVDRVPAQEGTRRSPVPLLPPPSGTPFNPATEAGQQKLARILLRAMIAAAKADGHVDAQEQARIFGEMDRLNLDADDKAFVMDELRAKLDIDAVASAATSQEEAVEIYAASLLSVDVDNAAERGYLAMLAARLGLDDALVAHLHANVAGMTEKAPA